MASNWEAHFSKGTTGARPAANTLPKGAIYWSTDDHKFYVGAGVANTWADFTAVLALSSDLASYAALAGATFVGDVIVPDEAYDATAWNGSLEVPTKNAVRDKIETLSAGTGATVQVKNVMDGAVATGTTILPFDNSIPQNTEGDQYMSLAITPTSATNKLRIDVVGLWTPSVTDWVSAALFQDSTAGALAAMAMFHGTATAGTPIVFTHYMTAGTTSATTFKVRAGKNGAGTTTFNGQTGGRIFGGVMASSITISELVP